jgi:Protein of unknown function (DUF2510)
MTQHETTTPGAPADGSGWFPDPSRAHELRYFDGVAWTDHVSDRGETGQSPLGLPPPGLVSWFSPEVVARGAVGGGYHVEVPRVKMWILAVLSAFVFRLGTPSLTIVLPIGLVFAVWCWRTTSEALRWHEQAGSPAVSEIKAARWVAVGLAAICLLQIPMWMH